MELVASGLIALFTGAVGAYLASRLALREHVNRHAVDKRIDWYEQTISLLIKYSYLNANMIDDIKVENTIHINQELSLSITTLTELMHKLSQAQIYGTSAAQSIADTALTELQAKDVELSKEARQIEQLMLTQTVPETLHQNLVLLMRIAEKQKAILDRTATELAEDVRILLNYE